MTEQKEILERISNLAFDIQRTDTLQVAFDKAQAIQNLVEGQQPFKVREYLKMSSGVLAKILHVDEEGIAKIRTVDAVDGRIYDTTMKKRSLWYENSRKLTITAEEIALFKRAEHFHSKGRKLNEFKINDVVSDQQGRFKVVDRSNGKYIYDIHGVIIEEIAYCTLIMTAEELEAAVRRLGDE